jgi:hypothetical protein
MNFCRVQRSLNIYSPMSDNIEPYLNPGRFNISLCEAVFIVYFVCAVAMEGYNLPRMVRGGALAAGLDAARSHTIINEIKYTQL